MPPIHHVRPGIFQLTEPPCSNTRTGAAHKYIYICHSPQLFIPLPTVQTLILRGCVYPLNVEWARGFLSVGVVVRNHVVSSVFHPISTHTQIALRDMPDFCQHIPTHKICHTTLATPSSPRIVAHMKRKKKPPPAKPCGRG
jgi:hypothetical protein